MKPAGVNRLEYAAEISPVVVSYKGLTITATNPPPERSPEEPRVSQGPFGAIDPQHKGGPKLTDLVEALNQLCVPAADRIAIIEELHKTGKLHATLMVQR